MTTDSNILIVDDVEQNLIALDALIARPGLCVLKASSGIEALELLLKNEVALALIDVQMPQMDGFELAELVRGNRQTCDVPLIFLTADSGDAQRSFRGYQAGAVDFLSKPIEPNALRSKVAVFVKLHQQKKQLLAQLDELREAVRLNEMFTAVLGHDLRNPLSAVLSGASLLLAVSGDPTITNTATRIQSSGRRMANMVNQLLDVTHLRAGGLILNRQPGDYQQLCRRIVDELAGRAQVARVTIESKGNPAGVFDPERLSQVMSNLVGNALQHSTIDTQVHLMLDGTDPAVMVIAVENAGAISEDKLNDIFKPFRSQQERKTAKAGLGLGLYIVDRLVNAHGGTVTVRSSESTGTIFTVTLPRQPGTTATIAGIM